MDVDVGISVLVRSVCVDGSDDVSAAVDGSVDVGISVLINSVWVAESEDVSAFLLQWMGLLMLEYLYLSDLSVVMGLKMFLLQWMHMLMLAYIL